MQRPGGSRLLVQVQESFQHLQPLEKALQLARGEAGQQRALPLERKRHQLGVQAPARLGEAHLPFAPVPLVRGTLDEIPGLELRDRPADAGLVHARAAGDVLGSAGPRPHGGHDAPLRKVQAEALLVNGREVFADAGRQAIQAEGNEGVELYPLLGFGPPIHGADSLSVANATICVTIVQSIPGVRPVLRIRNPDRAVAVPRRFRQLFGHRVASRSAAGEGSLPRGLPVRVVRRAAFGHGLIGARHANRRTGLSRIRPAA